MATTASTQEVLDHFAKQENIENCSRLNDFRCGQLELRGAVGSRSDFCKVRTLIISVGFSFQNGIDLYTSRNTRVTNTRQGMLLQKWLADLPIYARYLAHRAKG